MTRRESPLVPQEHELLVALRQENSALRERLEEAATTLHDMKAELLRQTEEGAKLRQACDSLSVDKNSLEKWLESRSETAEDEIRRLRVERRELEESQRSYRSESKQRAQVLLRERLVAQGETALVRTRLESQLVRTKEALVAAKGEVKLLRVRLAEIDERSARCEDGEAAKDSDSVTTGEA